MHIHPDIAALRSDSALQRKAQDTIERQAAAWREKAISKALRDDLVAFSSGCELAECKAVHALLKELTTAQEFVESWIGSMICALREHPLAQVPVRHTCSSALSRVQLMSTGRVTISLMAYEPVRGAPKPESALFCDRETFEIVLSGSARGAFHRLNDGQISSQPMSWQTGDTIHCRARTDARQFHNVSQSMLIVQLSREPECPGPSTEIRLGNNAVLHRASGHKQSSQNVMALNVLGALDFRTSVDIMREVALDARCEPETRWEAVRQLLALDTAIGLALLNELSVRRQEPLSAPARSLRENLAEPLEGQPCHA